MDIISTSELAQYLKIDDSPDLQLLVALTNGIVSEAWVNPAGLALAPAWVEAIAYEVAARAYRNPQGLSSWTVSIDDGSRTQRLPDHAARAGVYLTDLERAQLAGVGAVSTVPWAGSFQMITPTNRW